MSPVWMRNAGCSAMAFTRSIVWPKRAVDVGIGVLGEADVGVADLHEQWLAERGDAVLSWAAKARSMGVKIPAVKTKSVPAPP